MLQKKHKGYTLIELMVVFSLIGIFMILTIPSYINFNRAQEVRQSALFLKSKIRDAQNRSFSGEKSQTSCTEANILSGFYIYLTLNSSDFATGGRCGSTDFSIENQQLTSKNAKITAFKDLSGGSCNPLAISGSSIRINYRPIGKGVDFYDWNTQAILSVTKVAAEVADTNGNKYYIIINSTGDINEATSC